MATSSFYLAAGGGRFAMPSHTPAKVSSLGFSVGPLFQMAPYGSTGFSRASASPKSWLPPPREPVLNADGTMRSSWYRALDYLFNQRMGGINGPSMGEVQTNVLETKTAAVNAAVAVSAVETMAVTNAEALKATVQVTQTNSLTGAEQIPEVILRAPNKLYLDSYL